MSKYVTIGIYNSAYFPYSCILTISKQIIIREHLYSNIVIVYHKIKYIDARV